MSYYLECNCYFTQLSQPQEYWTSHKYFVIVKNVLVMVKQNGLL